MVFCNYINEEVGDLALRGNQGGFNEKKEERFGRYY